jgi:putative ABC transport system permease protein
MSMTAGLKRSLGTAGASTLALALLVTGCVFAALAGPALSLHTRSEAFGQTMAKLAPTVKTVQVSAALNDISQPPSGLISTGPALTLAQLDQLTRQITASLARLPLPLAADAWHSLGVVPITVGSGAAASAVLTGQPPRMEVLYRDPLASNATLVAGSYSAPASLPAGTVAVTVTAPTAARFGLHPGSRLTLEVPSGTVTLDVTGIVAARQPAGTFWTQDPLAAQPSITAPAQAKPYWAAAALADPSQLGAIQTAFAGPGLEANWAYPLAVSGLNADQAQGLASSLNRATVVTLKLTGPLAYAANSLAVTSPLTGDLSSFLTTAAGIQTVLLLLQVSLVVIAAAVLLLAARVMVARRAGELALLRARGGSLGQVTGLMAGNAALAAIPGALIGAAVALTAVPGDAAAAALGWWLAGLTLAVALAGPALIAAWQHRRPAPASNPARITTAETRPGRVAWRRPVAEITACAACIAGLAVLRGQGVPAGGGVNLLLTVAPVLVAVPVVVIMLRLYPLAVRVLLAVSARRSGATGFVALAAAARSSLTGLVPAFALVLALSLAAFAGMVGSGVSRGEAAAAWQASGADVAVQLGATAPPVTPADLAAIAAVRGVTHVTAVWATSWVTPFGQPVTVIAVDSASYAAVAAATPFGPLPAFPGGGPAGAARALAAGAAVPVLASPGAAALLGREAVQLSTLIPAGPISVRVAGIVTGTPAEPGGGAFVVLPMLTLPGPAGQPAPNLVLASGPDIDRGQLSAVLSRVLPGSTSTVRAAVLAALTSSPLPHGAAFIVVVTLAEAAVLALLVMILALTLGSADRELTLARLAVMGHERGTSLALAEAMPAVLAAVVAGAVCAVVLPHLIGTSIDLSAFTGTSAPVTFQPNLTALGLPAAAVLVLAAAVLAAEARTLRRHGMAGLLRAH